MSDEYGVRITLPGLSVVGDLSASQYHAVKFASTANVVIALAASTDIACGILQDAPDASGEAATVAAIGVSVAVAGTSTLSAGDRIQFDSTGRIIAASGQDLGQVLQAAGAVSDELRVLLD